MRFLFALLVLCVASVPAAARTYIYAASSIAPAFEELAASLPAYDIAVVPAATGALARQIANGAPSGLFIAAHPLWADWLAGRGLIAESRVLAGNRLVLASSCGAAPVFTPAGRLAGSAPFALADPDFVPAGLYGREALIHYGLWEDAAARAVYAASASGVLAWLLRGEASAGVIYASDLARYQSLCSALDFSPQSHRPVRYVLALLHGADKQAQAFYQLAAGEQTRAILLRHGFAPVE